MKKIAHAMNLDTMSPREIVQALDQHVVGQGKAKRLIALALRNRVRRKELSPELKEEVTPKNIIMIGSTGVGKTEIARRISQLSGAPFIKVEATKFTEVGYVGRDVESMVRDLMLKGVDMVRKEQAKNIESDARREVEAELVKLLMNSKVNWRFQGPDDALGQLRAGELEDIEVRVDMPRPAMPQIDMMGGGSPEALAQAMEQLQSMFGGGAHGAKQRDVAVKHAREILLEARLDAKMDKEKIVDIARERVEQMGIIFIDEIDKITSNGSMQGAEVSREGVQRDILPIVEGSQVATKYGVINTSHILFIAAGAFHHSKPSDLIPELQGRFPLRVELGSLGAEELVRILKEPKHSLLKQYEALFATEGVTLSFDDDAIDAIGDIAARVNERTDNIGARRLHTIMEQLLEELSFSASELKGQSIPITKEYVHERLDSLITDEDLSRFIL